MSKQWAAEVSGWWTRSVRWARSARSLESAQLARSAKTAPALAPAPAALTSGEPPAGVDLTGVSFRYRAWSDDVLSRIDLAIAPGRTVGVVGRGGCGKSTLAALLSARYSPTSGTIVRGKKKTASFDVPRRAARVAVVREDATIFAVSVAANIRASIPTASLDDVIAAARAAGLHDDIVQMRRGYDTVLAPAGRESLSLSQRQRLGLARAILARPPILVLDEALSALDLAERRRVHENLAELGCTCLVLTRDVATVAALDDIVVLDEGHVVARGSHGALIASDPIYRELANVSVSVTESVEVPFADALNDVRRSEVPVAVARELATDDLAA